MTEAEFHTALKNKFTNNGQVGFFYKIPDPSGQYAMMASKRPYDAYMVFPNLRIDYEGKFLKGGLQAFALDRVEDHQYASLLALRELRKDHLGGEVFPVVVGFWVPRKSTTVFIFDILLLQLLREEGKKSLLKKELEKLLPYSFDIKDKTVTADVFRDKLITREVYGTEIGFSLPIC